MYAKCSEEVRNDSFLESFGLLLKVVIEMNSVNVLNDNRYRASSMCLFRGEKCHFFEYFCVGTKWMAPNYIDASIKGLEKIEILMIMVIIIN